MVQPPRLGTDKGEQEQIQCHMAKAYLRLRPASYRDGDQAPRVFGLDRNG